MSTDVLAAATDLESEPPAPAGDLVAVSEFVTVIERRSGWRLLDWKELHAYRDLFRFLVWRQVKVRYAQSAIGIGWAIIQPVFSMLLFTVVFGKLAKVSSDGVPYALFSFAALVPWTYFSNALTDGVNSLVSEANMLRKVYFPRILMPLSAVAAKLVDFTIAMVCLALLMAAFQHLPPWQCVFVPLLVVLMVVTAAAVSIWLTALAIQYRDIKHAMTFVVQLAMYASPVVYPTSLIPDQYRLLYAINPMVGVIEGFRAGLLGTQPMPWSLIAIGAAVASALLLTGLAYFRSKERVFADVA
ncbi:Teichoic acid translocation permease protein TagG [Posidoniimonas corsicana]|uniref:Transport permease protein n=1 Tax=Posidoniimonas corsicana TaxID=1938618 RepID=A0A5C5V5G3_9BACT|nr:ABC transporter permease [Posidoniimonas corsicana]TWT33784.1 Teichoic acid translocation permease protein TagG [Posidoniimonas corsicana]